MKKLLAAVACAAFLFGLCSCRSSEKRYTASTFEYFDTITEVIGYASSEEEFENTKNYIFSELEKYHKLYDIYNSYDGIANINTVNSSRKPTKVDRELIDLIEFGKNIYPVTCGKMNIAMGTVLSLWHDCREEGTRFPEEAELISASEHCSIDDIIIDKENGTLFLADGKMSLDIGAIAKGYAAKMISEALREKGISGYLISIGGNVCTVGSKPDGEMWIVGIENPDGGFFEKVCVSDMSVVTSGSYQRYFELDVVRYHHIIDPDTLMPKNDYVSVTVISEDSALADTLSTALFNMDIGQGKTLLLSFENAYAMWVTAEGEKIYSDGFERFIVKNGL